MCECLFLCLFHQAIHWPTFTMAANSPLTTTTMIDTVVTVQLTTTGLVGTVNVTMPTPTVAIYTQERLPAMERLFGRLSVDCIIPWNTSRWSWDPAIFRILEKWSITNPGLCTRTSCTQLLSSIICVTHIVCLRHSIYNTYITSRLMNSYWNNIKGHSNYLASIGLLLFLLTITE